MVSTCKRNTSAELGKFLFQCVIGWGSVVVSPVSVNDDSPEIKGVIGMPNLTKVPYDINSANGVVRACLRKKREVAQSQDDGGINGIGAGSCCSFVTYIKHGGEVDNVFGNSRIRIPFKVNGVDVANACAHGELTALWNAIADEPGIPTIVEMYIEMSPCSKCQNALNNLLQPGQEIYYSFDHPDEVEAWKVAAKHLCA
nr:hypothetical protein [Xanthomonas oryzae]